MRYPYGRTGGGYEALQPYDGFSRAAAFRSLSALKRRKLTSHGQVRRLKPSLIARLRKALGWAR